HPDRAFGIRTQLLVLVRQALHQQIGIGGSPRQSEPLDRPMTLPHAIAGEPGERLLTRGNLLCVRRAIEEHTAGSGNQSAKDWTQATRIHLKLSIGMTTAGTTRIVARRRARNDVREMERLQVAPHELDAASRPGFSTDIRPGAACRVLLC